MYFLFIVKPLEGKLSLQSYFDKAIWANHRPQTGWQFLFNYKNIGFIFFNTLNLTLKPDLHQYPDSAQILTWPWPWPWPYSQPNPDPYTDPNPAINPQHDPPTIFTMTLTLTLTLTLILILGDSCRISNVRDSGKSKPKIAMVYLHKFVIFFMIT